MVAQVMVVVLILGFLLFLGFHLHYRRSKKLLVDQLRQEVEQLKNKLPQKKQHETKKESYTCAQQTIQEWLQIISRKNHFYQSMQERLSGLKVGDQKSQQKALKQVNALLLQELNTKQEWQQCFSHFERAFPFIYGLLSKQYPSLSKNDWKFILLTKLGYEMEDMMLIMGISIDGVKKARYRVRKKLRVKGSVLFKDFIAQLQPPPNTVHERP